MIRVVMTHLCNLYACEMHYKRAVLRALNILDTSTKKTITIIMFIYVTQCQLIMSFAVKLILSYEQKCEVTSKFLKN